MTEPFAPEPFAPEPFARIRASFARQGLMQTFAARIETLAPGRCTIIAPITPATSQQHGAAHAGLTFALGDSAAGYAALSLMAPEAEVLTVEMKISLLAPAVGEALVARGEVVRAGRRLTFVRAEVFARAGAQKRLVALLLGTMIAAPA